MTKVFSSKLISSSILTPVNRVNSGQALYQFDTCHQTTKQLAHSSGEATREDVEQAVKQAADDAEDSAADSTVLAVPAQPFTVAADPSPSHPAGLSSQGHLSGVSCRLHGSSCPCPTCHHCC